MNKGLTAKGFGARMRRHLTPFNIVEKLLTATSLGLVVATVGTKLAPILGLTGEVGTGVAIAAALTLDALWLGASIRADQAIRQRNWVGAIVMGAVTLAAIAASVAVLAILGHASVYASVPVVALAFSGLRIYSENAMADTITTKRIAERSAADRNKAALAASSARQRLAESTTGVILDTAEHIASLERDVALAKRLTKADIRMSKVRAQAQKKLAKAEEKHGVDARLFLTRGTAVPELEEGVSEAETIETGTTSDLRDQRDPDVSEAVTDAVERVEPEVSSTVTAKELLALGSGLVLVKTVDLRDSSGHTEEETDMGEAVTDDGKPTDQRDCDVTGVPDPSTYSLEELAQAEGVDVPVPGSPLNHDQVEVAMRFLRYQMQPPRSYRSARAEFKRMGFKASEEKLRLVWRHLEALAEKMAGAQ